jgi:hypothetical protein
MPLPFIPSKEVMNARGEYTRSLWMSTEVLARPPRLESNLKGDNGVTRSISDGLT